MYRNGVSLGSSFGVFGPNDTLRVAVQTPVTHCGVTHVVVTAGEYTTVWTLTTQTQAGHFLLPQYATKDFNTLPTIGEPDTANNSLVVLNDSLAVLSTVVLTATPTNVLSQKTYLNVLDKSRNKVYVADIENGVVAKVYVPPAGSTIQAIDYYPKYSYSVAEPTRLVVALSSPDKIVILDKDYVVAAEYALPAAPSALLCDVNSNVLVAFAAPGLIKKYSVAADLLTFVRDFYYESPDFLAEDPLVVGRFIVGSSERKTASVISSIMLEVAALHDIIVQVAVASTGVGYIADSYCNSVRIVDDTYAELSRIEAPGPVSGLALIGQNLYYSDLYNSTVYKYDTQLSITVSSVVGPSLLAASTYNGSLVVLKALPNINLALTTSLLTPIDSVVIPFTDNVPISTVVQSDGLTISGLIRPAVFYAEPYPGVELLKNDVLQSTTDITVQNGDVVLIRQTSPDSYYTQRDVRVGSCSVGTTYSVRTEPDLWPDDVYFVTKYDQYINLLAESNEIVISGLTVGVQSEIFADFLNTVGAYYLNDELVFTPTILVSNGDRVRLVVLIDGPVGAVNEYKMYHGEVPFATFKIVTITLDGATIWPYFAVLKTYAEPELLERVHLLSTVVDASLEVLKPITVDVVTSLALKFTPISVELPELGATIVRTAIEVANSAVSHDSGIKVQDTLVTYGIVSGSRDQSSQMRYELPTQAKGGITVIPVDLPYTEGILLGTQSALLYLPIGIKHVYKLVEADLPLYGKLVYDLTFYELSSPSITSFDVLTADQGFMGEVVNTQVLVQAQYDLQIVNDYYGLTTVVQMRISEPMPVELVFDKNVNYSKPVFFRSTDAIRYAIKERQSPEVELRKLHSRIAPYRPTIGSVYSYGVYMHIMSSQNWLQSYHESEPLDIVLTTSTFNASPLPGADRDTRTVVLTTGVVAKISTTNAIKVSTGSFSRRITDIRVMNGAQVEIVQDIVTFCPPYGSCELKGLYSDSLDAFDAARNSGHADMTEEYVPFKGCYLWKVYPDVFVLKYCSSVGPNDLFIVPYAWNLSMGPLRIAKTQLKINRYLNGG